MSAGDVAPPEKYFGKNLKRENQGKNIHPNFFVEISDLKFSTVDLFQRDHFNIFNSR